MFDGQLTLFTVRVPGSVTMTFPKRTPIGAVLLLAVAVGRLQADDSESNVEAYVKSVHGGVIRDDKAEGTRSVRNLVEIGETGWGSLSE
jgi:hypothetical protein